MKSRSLAGSARMLNSIDRNLLKCTIHHSVCQIANPTLSILVLMAPKKLNFDINSYFVCFRSKCTKKLNLDYNVLTECANSLEGVAIEYLMAGQTLALDPPHNWVPWITINGQHTDEIQDKATTNLLQLVCETYPVSDFCQFYKLIFNNFFSFSGISKTKAL